MEKKMIAFECGLTEKRAAGALEELEAIGLIASSPVRGRRALEYRLNASDLPALSPRLPPVSALTESSSLAHSLLPDRSQTVPTRGIIAFLFRLFRQLINRPVTDARIG